MKEGWLPLQMCADVPSWSELGDASKCGILSKEYYLWKKIPLFHYRYFEFHRLQQFTLTKGSQIKQNKCDWTDAC